MSGIHMDFEAMNRDGVATINNSNEFNELINALQKNKDGLMGIWNGSAALAFSDQVDEQIRNLNEFYGVLNLLGQKIVDGANLYRTTEEENKQAATRLFDQNTRF